MARVLRMDKAAPETWEDALKQFLWFKQAQGVSDRTLYDYQYHVTTFFQRYPDAYQEENLKPAVFEYMAQKVAPCTFNLRLGYLRAFLTWCVKEGIFTANPLADIKRKKAEDRVVSLDTDTLKKLLTLPDRKTFAGLRDYSLILLTLDTAAQQELNGCYVIETSHQNMTAKEIWESYMTLTKVEGAFRSLKNRPRGTAGLSPNRRADKSALIYFGVGLPPPDQY